MGDWRASGITYARADEGTYLAFQTMGRGDPLLVISDGFIPIDAIDDEPSLAAAFHRLAASFFVIRYDRRGVGLSDRVDPDRLSLEHWADDAVAVLDAAGVERASVLAPTDAGLVAVTLAARSPKRVDRLVLVNSYARLTEDADHPGSPSTLTDGLTERILQVDGSSEPFDLLAHIAPSVADDGRFRRWWDVAGRRGATPSSARAFRRLVQDADVRPLLPSVRAPTLVIQRRRNWYAGPSHGRLLAHALPDGRYVELDGPDAIWWVGDQAGLLSEVERFLGTTPVVDALPRQFVALLFTDIVDSTGRAVTLGDAAWAEQLDGYERIAHTEIERCGGEVVKGTGDGTLAWFSGASAAVASACALVDASRGLGLSIRAAVHAGEVAVRGRDLSGVALHVAARILALAGPDEVLVSDAVARLAADAGSRFVDRGPHTLRGVAEPVDVLVVVPDVPWRGPPSG